MILIHVKIYCYQVFIKVLYSVVETELKLVRNVSMVSKHNDFDLECGG